MIVSKVWPKAWPKGWLITVAAVAAVASSAATAQDLKIGVINVARLIEQSPQAESVTKALQEEFGPRQRDITAMQTKLRTDTEKFQRDSPVMAEAERLTLERQIRDA